MSDLKDAMEGLGPVASDLGASGTTGQILRGAREARRLSLDDVAQHLKYAPRQIEALERDDYLMLPAATVVRGMVRSYAKFLELAPEPLLDAVNKHLAPSSAVPVGARDTRGMAVPFPTQATTSHRGWYVISALIALGVIAVAVDWSALRDIAVKNLGPFLPSLSESAPAPASEAPAAKDGVTTIQIAPTSADGASSATTTESTGAAAAPAATVAGAAATTATATSPAAPTTAVPAVTATPAGAAPAAAAPAAADGPVRKLEMRFAKDSWVEIRTADNRILMNQLNPGGTTRALEAPGELRLSIGAADGVTLTYDGKPVDLAPLIQQGVARVTLK